MAWSKTAPTLAAGSEWVQQGTTKYQDNNVTITSVVSCGRLSGKGFSVQAVITYASARNYVTDLNLQCNIGDVTGEVDSSFKGKANTTTTLTLYFTGEADPGTTITVLIYGPGRPGAYGGSMSFTAPELAGNTVFIKVNGVWKEGQVKINVNGVWKDAMAKFRTGGTWK